MLRLVKNTLFKIQPLPWSGLGGKNCKFRPLAGIEIEVLVRIYFNMHRNLPRSDNYLSTNPGTVHIEYSFSCMYYLYDFSCMSDW